MRKHILDLPHIYLYINVYRFHKVKIESIGALQMKTMNVYPHQCKKFRNETQI